MPWNKYHPDRGSRTHEVSAWDHLSKLLQRALGSRMSCQVEMQDSTRSDLHHDEHIENAKARRYRNKEIAQLGAVVILQAIEDRVTNCPLPTRQALEF